MKPLVLLCALALAGCGRPPTNTTSDGGDDGGGSSSDGGGPAVDLRPAVDPCTYATLGDGAYCGGNLQQADPGALYVCKALKSSSVTACPDGCHLAPSGVPDYCEPPKMPVPPGKGIWIWTLGSTAPTAAVAAAQLKQLGVGFVLLKSGEDEATYTTNFSAANVAEFTSRGIEVFGWPYVRPGNIAAKAAAVAQQAKVPGVKGIILDVEGEFVGHDADAAALCDGIRQRVPGVFLGYTTFGWVAYHHDFPYHAFDDHCGDAFLPQTYWDLWTTGPTGGLAKGVDGAKALGLKAPIWPAQDNEKLPSTADLNQFFDAAGPRASLWRMYPASAAQTGQLPSLHWKN